MKKILVIAFVLLAFTTSVYAQNATNITTTTSSTSAFPFPTIPPSLTGIYSFLISINPILLMILGVILILVSKLSKFVGIVLIIIAIIHFLFMFLK